MKEVWLKYLVSNQEETNKRLAGIQKLLCLLVNQHTRSSVPYDENGNRQSPI